MWHQYVYCVRVEGFQKFNIICDGEYINNLRSRDGNGNASDMKDNYNIEL